MFGRSRSSYAAMEKPMNTFRFLDEQKRAVMLAKKQTILKK